MTTRAPTKEALLERAAARLADDDGFLASTLRAWSGDRLDLDAVAAFLGCSRETATQIALCRRPRSETSTFRTDVAKIAAYAKVDEARLLGLVREAASLAAFRKSGGTQMLAAARDARDPEKGGKS